LQASCCGALSERTGLSFASVTVSSSVFCQDVQFPYYMSLNVSIYSIQGLSQSWLSTADLVISLVAPAATAVWSLEQSYS
jgi:hypothetical protein